MTATHDSAARATTPSAAQRAGEPEPLDVTMTSAGRWQPSRAGVALARFYWVRGAQHVHTMTGQPLGLLTRRGVSALSSWDAHAPDGRAVAVAVHHDAALAALIDQA